ncbi:MAG: hypothetical protein K2M19_01490 [Muribaculaceae bacterium]|nr:hypothetical protein [Muribaculaceae bacterium]
MPEPNQNDELRARFRSQLQGPFSEIYFSEEELVSIFDTAGDSNDDYIRQEVLMVGARLYPDSEALLARRGIFYNQTDPEVFSRFMEDHEGDESDLMKLLKTENFKGTSAQALAIVEEMFNTGNFDDDEFVIQFVQAVHRLGQVNWLIERYPDIHERVTYEPTLLYEIGIVAQDSPALRPLAIECLEKLTETDPFTADFWSLLAYLYILEGEQEKSSSAIEYALALEPGHVEALKGRLRLTDPEKDPEAVTDILLRILDSNPDNELLDTALVIARNMNRDDIVHRLIRMIPDTSIPSYTTVSCAIITGYPDLYDLLARAAEGGVATIDDWRGLLESAHYSGNAMAFDLIQDMYARITGEPLEHEYIRFMRLWETKEYESAITLFQNADSSGTLRLAEHFFEGMILYITMLLRLGHPSEAFDMASGLLKAIDSDTPLPGSRIERIGARRIISFLTVKSMAPVAPGFWEQFDPFAQKYDDL